MVVITLDKLAMRILMEIAVCNFHAGYFRFFFNYFFQIQALQAWTRKSIFIAQPVRLNPQAQITFESNLTGYLNGFHP